MANVTFTLTDGWSSPTGSVEVAFEPRNTPWLNDVGKIVTPPARDPQSYALGSPVTVDLDPGPWRIRIGQRRFAFTVPAGGGPLWPMIALQAGLPVSTSEEVLTAALGSWLAGKSGVSLGSRIRPIRGIDASVTAVVTAGYTGADTYWQWDQLAGRARVCGANLSQGGSPSLGWNNISGIAPASNGNNGFDIEFWTNATTVRVWFYSGNKPDLWVMVDDMRVIPGWQYANVADGTCTLTITKDASRRKIRIGLPDTALAGFGTNAGAAVGATVPGVQVAMIGASYIQGVNIAAEGGRVTAGTVAGELTQETGWDVWRLAHSGSGYIAQGDVGTSSGPFGSPARMAALAALPALDAIMVCSTANDRPFTPAAVVAAAQSLWAAIKTARPTTPLIVTGVESGWAGDTTLAALNAALKSAAASSPAVDAFLDLRSPQIITGTGYYGSPQGDGNADVFLSGDNLHPMHAGSRYYAQRLAALLAPAQVLTGMAAASAVAATPYDGGIDE